MIIIIIYLSSVCVGPFLLSDTFNWPSSAVSLLESICCFVEYSLGQRVELDINNADQTISMFQVSVVSSPYPEYAAWIGGSILASLPTFKQRWITRQDYMEWGDNIFRLKCLRY